MHPIDIASTSSRRSIDIASTSHLHRLYIVSTFDRHSLDIGSTVRRPPPMHFSRRRIVKSRSAFIGFYRLSSAFDRHSSASRGRWMPWPGINLIHNGQ